MESEIGSLAEAMPADKYNFAPTAGEFKTVRTFAQQMSHIATVIYEVSAASLGEKTPVDTGTNENGPANLRSKAAIDELHEGRVRAGASSGQLAYNGQHDGHDAIAVR